MREVIVFAEGPTEERFIKQVVAPALHGMQIYLKPQLLNTSQSGRGGALCIGWFQEAGWLFGHGPELHSWRVQSCCI